MRTGYDRLTSCAAFSPDGRVLALPSASQAILLWDVWRSKELRRIEGFGAEVVSLAFSPDDDAAATDCIPGAREGYDGGLEP